MTGRRRLIPRLALALLFAAAVAGRAAAGLRPAERDGARAGRSWEWVAAAAIACGFVLLTLAYVGDVGDLLGLVAGRPVLRLLAVATVAWTALGLVLLACRTAGWFSYRPFAPAGPADAPTLCVVIPAYNEGVMVRYAIESAALRPRVLSLFDRLVTNAYIPVRYLSFPLLFVALGGHRTGLPAAFALYIGWISIFYLLYYLRQQRPASVLYALFYPYYSVCALFWILPYSALTLRNRSWMTR